MRLGSLLVTSLIQASGKQQTFLKSRTDQPVGASVLLRGESPTTATHLLSLVALVYTGSRPGYLTQLHLSAVGLSFSVSRRVKLFCKGTSGYREDTASPQPSWQAMSNLHSPLLWSPCSLEAAYRGVQGSAVTAAPPHTQTHTSHVSGWPLAGRCAPLRLCWLRKHWCRTQSSALLWNSPTRSWSPWWVWCTSLGAGGSCQASADLLS